MEPKKLAKNIAVAAVTLALLWWAFSRIDFLGFVEHIRNINYLWFGVFVFLLLPQILVIVVRLRLLASKETTLPFMAALKISMSGSILNLVLPSKGGDLAKAVFFKKLGLMKLTEATGLVIFEKATDLFALCAFTIFGIIMMGHLASAFGLPILLFSLSLVGACIVLFIFDFKFLTKQGNSKVRKLVRNMYIFFLRVRDDKMLLGKILLLAGASWAIQLAQFWVLFVAFGQVLNPAVVFALVPMALLFSMLPVSVSGWGLRESAMLVLFAPFAPASIVLGVSILSSLRYYIPAIVGAVFFYDIAKAR